MNKIIIFLLLLECFLITGCLASQGYTPNEDISIAETGPKYAITFSVDCISYVKEDLIDLKENRIQWIKEYLEESGAFSDVSYRDYSARSKYHIRFFVRILPPDTRHAGDMGLIAGLSFGTIPVCSDRFYYDISAAFALNDELICTPSTSERISEFIWLPLLPALFYPPVFVRKSVEKKCFRHLINEIIEEHKKVILKTSKTSSTQKKSSGNTSLEKAKTTNNKTSTTSKIKPVNMDDR